MNKKRYNTPDSKVAAMTGKAALMDISGIHPGGEGSGNIFGGEGSSTDHPLDSKYNAWSTFEDDEDDDWDKL